MDKDSIKLKKLYIEPPEQIPEGKKGKRNPVWNKRWRVWIDGTYMGDITLLPDGKTYQLSVTLKLDNAYVKEGRRMKYNPHHANPMSIKTEDKEQVVPLFKKILKENLLRLFEG